MWQGAADAADAVLCIAAVSQHNSKMVEEGGVWLQCRVFASYATTTCYH
jgi:hypothetical protein